MAGSTYKIIELVGTSSTSWEEAAKTAIETAGSSLRDLRVSGEDHLQIGDAVVVSLETWEFAIDVLVQTFVGIEMPRRDLNLHATPR